MGELITTPSAGAVKPAANGPASVMTCSFTIQTFTVPRSFNGKRRTWEAHQPVSIIIYYSHDGVELCVGISQRMSQCSWSVQYSQREQGFERLITRLLPFPTLIAENILVLSSGQLHSIYLWWTIYPSTDEHRRHRLTHTVRGSSNSVIWMLGLNLDVCRGVMRVSRNETFTASTWVSHQLMTRRSLTRLRGKLRLRG